MMMLCFDQMLTKHQYQIRRRKMILLTTITCKKVEIFFFNIVSGLISFTRFTDYGAYFSLPLPFSVYLGVAVAAFGILLCIFVGIANGIRRYV